MDGRTPLEKLVIVTLIEHGILGVSRAVIITPQQAMGYIRIKDFAYRHTEKGSQNGGSGGTFRFTNLRWKGMSGGGVEMIFDTDSTEFDQLTLPARASEPWTARYRDRSISEKPKVHITAS